MSRCRDLSSLTINSGCRTDTRPVKCRIPGQCSLCRASYHACMLPSLPTRGSIHPTTGNECISVCSRMAARQSRVFVRAAHPHDPGVAYLPPCPPNSRPGSPSHLSPPPALPSPPDMHICSLDRTGGSPSQAGRPQTTELTAAPSSHSSLSCVLTVAPCPPLHR